MKKILVYRFSAFGDVAMVANVLQFLSRQNPGLEIVMVSRPMFAPLFANIPGVTFVGIKIEEYKDIFGLTRLALHLAKTYRPDAVADLHFVLRTKWMDEIFRLRGIKTVRLIKGRKEKKELIEKSARYFHPITPTHERYAEVFRKLNLQLVLPDVNFSRRAQSRCIGFAPFAQHREKMLSLEKSFQLAQEISKNYELILFGGPGQEAEILEKWSAQLPNTRSVAGKLSLAEELDLIGTLHTMISMDSANMHLASLAGTRCVSVWGSTHWYAGFLGYGQRVEDIVEVEDLPCRPCSIFGNKPCHRGDWACLEGIAIGDILKKV